jgi:hypothetical protein
VAGSCEHGYETSDSIKGRGSLDQLGDCQLLKKASATQSDLIILVKQVWRHTMSCGCIHVL